MRCFGLRILLFVIAAVVSKSVAAADVESYQIVKAIHYYQIGPGMAHLQTNNCYRFVAQVNATVVGDVLSASITTPKSAQIQLLPDADGDPFRFRDRFDPDERFALENFYPSGTYSLFIRTRNDGDRTMTFTLSGDAYPPAPVVNDYNAVQALPWNQYNEISWQAFAGGTASDFIQVQIENGAGQNIWETPDFGEEGALSGIDTRTMIPARTLNPGSVYFATIRFAKVLAGGSAAYRGAPGLVGYYSQTEFTLRAVGSALEPVIDRVQIWKRNRWEILKTGESTPETEQWGFEARVDTVSSNQLRMVNVQQPNSTTNYVFKIPSDGTTEFKDSHTLEGTFSDFAGLYPNGPHTFELVQPDGSTNRTVINFPDGSFPIAPKIHSVPSFHGRAPGVPLTVTWDAWVGADDPDFIRVELSDDGNKVWDTASFSNPGHLRPNATTVTIPGEYFKIGHDYELEVHFYKVSFSGTQIIPGALVFGGYESRTKVLFSTELPDARFFRVVEGQHFWQRGTEANHIAPDPQAPFRFEAVATEATNNFLLSTTVTMPNARELSLERDANGELAYRDVEGSAAELAQNYPAGTYQFVFNTLNDGVRTSSVRLDSTTLPPIPRIRNFGIITGLPTGDENLITWDPWIDVNKETDRVRFTLESRFGGVLFDSETAGNNIDAATNRVRVNYDLPANTVYLGRLRFERRERFELPSYPGAKGDAIRYSEVVFYVGTYSLRIRDVDLLNGDLRFSITLPISRTFALMTSTDLKTWTQVKTVRITSSTTKQIITAPPTGERAFYRWELVL